MQAHLTTEHSVMWQQIPAYGVPLHALAYIGVNYM